MNPAFNIKPTGLAALKAKATAAHAEAGALALLQDKPTPENVEERLGIVFDDSGSMSGDKIKDAHEGVEEFLRSCAKDKTSVAIYPMNKEPLHLSLNLPALALLTKEIEATGGTPLVKVSKRLLTAESLTRMIIFSDGVAGDNYASGGYFYAQITDGKARTEPIDEVITLALEKKLSIDTVYIADQYDEPDNEAELLLKKIASKTGGIYLRFERGKSNFRTAFKYLAPTYRAMLADKSFVEKLQEGKV
jgi:Mg-chelatase subunit ChlD